MTDFRQASVPSALAGTGDATFMSRLSFDACPE